ncbi:MAG: hypothetical protein KIT13_02560 [Burkholderiales bacterium]|nr:hypothetical protein [Burkholderiales bacterium]
MKTEVHVHGSVFLCKGVRLAQVELALRPWLDYVDADHLADAKSLERDEPGIAYDAGERVVSICWTGDVGRSFHNKLTEACNNLGPLTEYASEVEITYYQDNGEDEFHQFFVGPTPEAIHEFRRQCVVEDLNHMLSRHLGKQEVEEVTSLVTRMFDAHAPQKSQGGAPSAAGSSTVIPLHPRNRHLH